MRYLCFLGKLGNDTFLFVETKARRFCGQENVAEVSVLEKTKTEYYIEVVSSLPGGSSSFYKNVSSTPIQCLVVGPDSMTQECKNLLYSNLPKTKIC